AARVAAHWCALYMAEEQWHPLRGQLSYFVGWNADVSEEGGLLVVLEVSFALAFEPHNMYPP
ncbi:MAG: hypothetical protein IJ547_04810, partial [Clostridia bacterium]|nr:hypothetical protein [Clostridia bacterium]